MASRSFCVLLALVSVAAAFQYEVNIFNGIIDAPVANFTWNNVTASLAPGERSGFLWGVNNASEHFVLTVSAGVSVYLLTVKLDDVPASFSEGHLTLLVAGNVSAGHPPVYMVTPILQNPIVRANDTGIKFVVATDSLSYVNISSGPATIAVLMPLAVNQSVNTVYTPGFAGQQAFIISGRPTDLNRSVISVSVTSTFVQNRDYTAYITANETNVIVYFLEDIELNYVLSRVANFALNSNDVTTSAQLAVYSSQSTLLYNLFGNWTGPQSVSQFQTIAVPTSGDWIVKPVFSSATNYSNYTIPASMPSISTVVLMDGGFSKVVEEFNNVTAASPDNSIVRIYSAEADQNVWLDQHALTANAPNASFGFVSDYIAVDARNTTLWLADSNGKTVPQNVEFTAGSRYDIFLSHGAEYVPRAYIDQVSTATFKVSFLHAVKNSTDVGPFDLYLGDSLLFSSVAFGDVTPIKLQTFLNTNDSDTSFTLRYANNVTVYASVTLRTLLNSSFSLYGADILLVATGSRDQPELVWYQGGYPVTDSVKGDIQLRYVNLEPTLNDTRLMLSNPGNTNKNATPTEFATEAYRQISGFSNVAYQSSYTLTSVASISSVASALLNADPNSVYTVALLPTYPTLTVQSVRLGQSLSQYRVVNLVNTTTMDIFVDGWKAQSAVQYTNVTQYFLQAGNFSHNISAVVSGSLFDSYTSATTTPYTTTTNTTTFIIPAATAGSLPTLVPSVDYDLPYANNTVYVRYVNVGRNDKTVVRVGNATTLLPFGAVTPYVGYPIESFNFYFLENGNQTYSADKQFVGGSAFTVIYEGNGVVQYLYDNGAEQPFGPEPAPTSNDNTLPVWAWVLIGLGIAAVVGIIIGVFVCLCRRDHGAEVYQPI